MLSVRLRILLMSEVLLIIIYFIRIRPRSVRVAAIFRCMISILVLLRIIVILIMVFIVFIMTIFAISMVAAPIILFVCPHHLINILGIGSAIIVLTNLMKFGFSSKFFSYVVELPGLTIYLVRTFHFSVFSSTYCTIYLLAPVSIISC